MDAVVWIVLGAVVLVGLLVAGCVAGTSGRLVRRRQQAGVRF